MPRMMAGKHYTIEFWILSINFLIVLFGAPSITTIIETFEVLETSILPQFDLVKDRECILSPQNFQFTEVPVMRITGGTNWWNTFMVKVCPRPLWFARSLNFVGRRI